MKAERTTFHTGRHEQRMRAARDDSYKPVAKMPDPAVCPRCHASYTKGRWTWHKAAEDAVRQKCPACQRIEDRFPGGYLTLKGSYFAAHRAEVLNVIAAREARARAEHPMQRLIGLENTSEGALVTTTDPHLARGLAIAVHEAFKGDLDLAFSKDENLVRATWSR